VTVAATSEGGKEMGKVTTGGMMSLEASDPAERPRRQPHRVPSLEGLSHGVPLGLHQA
jgi:hypothetical protein